jgi:uncharacterized membrane protein required for colicin V production
MLDVAVGIVVFLFVALSLREGLAKSLFSLAAVFVALFLASAALTLLARGDARLADPKNAAAVILFLLVWAVSYLLIDLLLTLLLRKVVQITVLGPADRVGAVLVGGFKGTLICGIILQLVLAFPLSATVRDDILNKPLSRFTIAVYHWAYPYAQRLAPIVQGLMEQNLVNKVGEQQGAKAKAGKVEDYSPEKFLGDAGKYEQIKSEQEKKIHQLLKDQKLLRGAPLKKVEEVR